MTDHHVHTDLSPTIADARARRLGHVHGRGGDHHLRLRPLQRLPVHDRSERAVGWIDGLGEGGARGAGLPLCSVLSTRRRPRSTRSPPPARARRPTPRSRSTTSTRTSIPCRSTRPCWDPSATASTTPSARAGGCRASPPPANCSTTSRRSSSGTAPIARSRTNFLLQRIGIWFNHLNKGLRTTAISDTDTHTFGDLESAGARTWTRRPATRCRASSDAEVAQAVDAGRAVGGQGLYVQTRLLAGDGSGAVADLTLGGSTDVATTNGAADLEIRVQAPTLGALRPHRGLRQRTASRTPERRAVALPLLGRPPPSPCSKGTATRPPTGGRRLRHHDGERARRPSPGGKRHEVDAQRARSPG